MKRSGSDFERILASLVLAAVESAKATERPKLPCAKLGLPMEIPFADDCGDRNFAYSSYDTPRPQPRERD